ncbi:hypothetical protein [Consotaella salsifontis]|uniref:PilZ domain-containing protein n=1 Tax=Consotaella salsifontis TaxID=1365950 RepID=A0A1T4NSL5_9HYPH|nr:hypothetical protein [Consotaella salsifontis]SJZ82300.1 hypothetical protein SAMN05428963_103173 [Consotaella salsifontis]
MDCRMFKRLRTRLRPAKVLTLSARFVCDCAMTDQSERGAKLRFFKETALPEHFIVYDESEAQKRPAKLIWNIWPEAGVCFEGPPASVGIKERERIAGPYYAIGS